MSRSGPQGRYVQAASPARVCLVALAPGDALALADEVLRSQHARLRRTGATGARVYTLGSVLGEIVLMPVSWLLGPWAWRAVHAHIVVDAVADPTSGGARTWLTVSMPELHRSAGAQVAPRIEAVVAACAARGVLLDAGAPLSSADLPDGPAQLTRFRRLKGD